MFSLCRARIVPSIHAADSLNLHFTPEIDCHALSEYSQRRLLRDKQVMAAMQSPNVVVGGVMMLFKFTLLAAFSLLVIILGVPNLEQSREEARSAQAFIMAQQIKSGDLPVDSLDSWGNKFEITRATDNEIIVVSRGSNTVTPTTGYDSDDVSNSMSNPPHRRAMRRKQTQILCVLALAAAPWLVVLVTMVRQRCMPQQHPDTKAT